jgi:hypothetical protein
VSSVVARQGEQRIGARAPRRRRRRGDPTSVQEALFEVQVRPERRYFRQMLVSLARSGFGGEPLAAEATVSKLFGTVWLSAARDGVRDGTAEEAFGLAMVDYAAQQHTPTAVGLLRTTAAVAPIREVRQAAARAADALSARGVPAPPWSTPPGEFTPGRCWAFQDVFGDLSLMICEFGDVSDLRAADRHAIAIEVDHSRLSSAASAVLLVDVDAAIRDLKHDAKRQAPLVVLRQVDPTWAQAMLTRALARTDLVPADGIGEEFADVRALALARVSALPESASGLATQPPTTVDQAGAVAADFLASPDAANLPDQPLAERAVNLILGYGSECDPGQLVRVGPAMWETFLFEWLPDHAAGDLAAGALAPVVRAWSAWAGRRIGLPGVARDELAGFVDQLLAEYLADAKR